MFRSVLLGSALLAICPALAFAQTTGQPIRVIGAYMDPNTGQAGHVEIDVTRWSTDAETKRLLAILDEEGQEGFLAALQKNPRAGSLHTPGQLGQELRYASQAPLPDGGKDILIATDRRISFAEIWNLSRSKDYPITWIQIHLNSDGEGEGTLSLATKVIPTGSRDIVVESYDVMRPLLLRSLREERLRQKD